MGFGRLSQPGIVIGLLLAGLAVLGGEPTAWVSAPSGRFRPLSVPAAGRTGFSRVPSSESGLLFTNGLPVERSLTNHILMNGSGVALGDVDGDGRCDVFFAGLGGGSALFRNLGDWKFTNITASALKSAPGDSGGLGSLDATGALLADLDGDGLPELLVNSVGGGAHCWHNEGRGVFRDVTASSGLGSASGGSSFAAADVDGDGDLDLYVVRYRSSTVRDAFQQQFRIQQIQGRPTVTAVNGRPTTDADLVGRFTVDESGQITEHGEADQLFRNQGGCRFTPVSFTDGSFLDERGVPLTSPPYDWGLAAMFRDINGDGAPDLYVCNDLGSPDRIWINDGRGRFRAIARTAIRKTSWFSMGVDFGDLNRDGHDDFLVTDMLSRDPVRRQIDAFRPQTAEDLYSGSESRPQCPRNTLYAGRGDGTFAEVGWWSGLAASDWSWSPVFLDVDLDGYEDVLITTGFERDVQDGDVAAEIESIRKKDRLPDSAAIQLRRRFPSLTLPNLAFRNKRNLTFEETGKFWGFDQVGISQGIALADLDGDGDLDAVVNNQNEAPFLLRNESNAPRVLVRLRGGSLNTAGIGARITVEGGPVVQQQEVLCGGRYLSGDDPVRTFAAGDSTNRLTIRVRWRSGLVSVMEGVRADDEVELDEASASAQVRSMTVPNPTELFEDVSNRLNHRHFDEPFDELARQPLLSQSLSILGPGVAFGDLNRDGVDDLVVGTGRGGRMGVFIGDGSGGFRLSRSPILERPAPLDQTGILIWPRAASATLVLSAFSRYRSPDSAAGIRILDLDGGVVQLGGIDLSGMMGPLCSADVDGNGDLDLFVGGRLLPGRYPKPVSSGLFLRSQGMFAQDLTNTAALGSTGMAVGALFSDLDSDGYPELIVTGDWGPVRIFLNKHGSLVERDFPLEWANSQNRPDRLSGMSGCWTGVAAADLDEDGKMDLVVGNRGLNTRLGGNAVRMDYGDLDGNGSMDLVESLKDPNSGKWIPSTYRDRMVEAIPILKERFPTRGSFGRASVEDVIQADRSRMETVTMNTSETLVLLNRGDRFEVRILPMEAQWSPVFGISTADFDGDGHMDVFLSQNFFGDTSHQDRNDAGQGLLLRGDGRGELAPLPASLSGIRVPGQQRGAAVADFDGDGRPDLVVTEAGEATCLFRNRTGIPGLRVRLSAGGENPAGIGSQVRWLESGRPRGPLVEVRSGGGYWSQDSPVVVLGGRSGASAIRVHWPGGERYEFAIPAGAREVEIVRSPPKVTIIH